MADEYSFTKLGEVAAVAAPDEGANVLIEQDGEILRVPADMVGGGAYDLVLTAVGYVTDDGEWDVNWTVNTPGDYETIKRKILGGEACRGFATFDASAWGGGVQQANAEYWVYFPEADGDAECVRWAAWTLWYSVSVFIYADGTMDFTWYD